jgi:hypothetical protein
VHRALRVRRGEGVGGLHDRELRSAAVPLGWTVGCPLLGFVSDRLGRRKPVIGGAAVVLLGCMAWILFGPADVLPPYVLALVAGVASGAAMFAGLLGRESPREGLLDDEAQELPGHLLHRAPSRVYRGCCTPHGITPPAVPQAVPLPARQLRLETELLAGLNRANLTNTPKRTKGR